MIDLTIIILTKNEEKNLKKCLDSVIGFAKRIVIVDSFSTDNTKKIALSYPNVEFFEHEFENHAKQFSWGQNNTNINTKWIMKLDADEEILPELANEIQEKLENLSENINGVIIKRRVYFLGKWIKHGGAYPQKFLRIYKPSKGYVENKEMDEHIVVEGDTVVFDNDMIDYNTNNLEWWTNKHNWYSNKEVIETFKMRKQVPIESIGIQAKIKRFIKMKIYLKMPLFLRPKLYYIYRYYLLLGFLDGKEGKIYHFLQAYWYRFLVDAKIYEAEKYNIEYETQGPLKD